MNSRYPRKTPRQVASKRPKAQAVPSPSGPVAQARRKELDGAWRAAMQACLDQWEVCRESPYDTAAFEAYEWLCGAYWEALRAADPDRYTLAYARYREIERAYPRGFAQAMVQLSHGDVAALELPLRFLEMDPWVDGSGYTKERIIRLINRLDLPPDAVRRLQQVVLAVVDKADGRREFRSYCRLARRVDSEPFRQELERRLTFAPSRVGQRAQWVLEACRKR